MTGFMALRARGLEESSSSRFHAIAHQWAQIPRRQRI